MAGFNATRLTCSLFSLAISPQQVATPDRRRRTTRVSPVQPLGLFNPWVAKHESRRASPLGRSVGRDTSGDHEGSRPHRVRRRAASRRSGRVAHPSGQERQPTRRLDEHGDSTRRAQQRATPAAVRQDAGLQVMVASRRQGLGPVTTRTRDGSDGMVRRRQRPGAARRASRPRTPGDRRASARRVPRRGPPRGPSRDAVRRFPVGSHAHAHGEQLREERRTPTGQRVSGIACHRCPPALIAPSISPVHGHMPMTGRRRMCCEAECLTGLR